MSTIGAGGVAGSYLVTERLTEPEPTPAPEAGAEADRAGEGATGRFAREGDGTAEAPEQTTQS